MPIWNLVGFLALSWMLVFLILLKGIRSSGKAAYFLAIFPYVVLIILLIRALTLPGAFNGIRYFFTPQWDKILEPKVWYAAVTQVFFSLNVFFGSIVMYSSFNKFSHNVYRDANIVTTMDTFTSLIGIIIFESKSKSIKQLKSNIPLAAGCCVFGVLGNLAHELGIEDIEDATAIIKKGPGLAFISYPEAISKFKYVPQLFSALFFVMLYLLGIGTNIAMSSCVGTLIKDQFKSVKNWHTALGFSIFGTVAGSIYLTPVSFLQIYNDS